MTNSLKKLAKHFGKALTLSDGRPLYEHIGIVMCGLAAAFYIVVETLRLMGLI